MPTTTRFASSRFLYVIGQPRERFVGQCDDDQREVSSQAKRVAWSLDPDLLFVAVHGGARGVVGAQRVVEELLPLGLAQLRRQQRAHVDRAVELDVADDVPRDALVDGD